MLDNFLKVTGTFETGTKATTRCPPAVLIHIRLRSIKHLAHFTSVADTLSEYYSNSPDGHLRTIDLPFNLLTQRAISKWGSDLAKLVSNLTSYTNFVVFVTTHSDPNTGDLWLGEEKSQDNKFHPWAAAVGEVSIDL